MPSRKRKTPLSGQNRGPGAHFPHGGQATYRCCVCGAWACLGFDVGLRAIGRWYCGEHEPREAKA